MSWLWIMWLWIMAMFSEMSPHDANETRTDATWDAWGEGG